MRLFGRDFVLFGKPQKLEKEQDKNLAKKDWYLPHIERQTYLYRIDIANWRQAHQIALDIYRPRREQLVDVYRDAMLDTTLQAKLQTRTLNILNTPFQVLDSENEANQDLTNTLKSTWFYETLRYIIEAKYWGYSLICFKFKKSTGLVFDSELFPRENVIPNWCAVIPDTLGEQYISIEKEPYTNTYVLVDTKEFGLLLECARYTLFKKHATAHWSQYQEIFGMPYRFANTQSRDKKVLDNIFDNLKNMGSAGFGLFPTGTEINFLEASKGDPYKVFLEAIRVANQEISNRILGSIQSDNSEGSYAREKVNYDISNDITQADLRFVEGAINGQVLPLLSKWGYSFEGFRFAFNQSWELPLANTQLEIDKFLAEHYEIDEDYIQDTYGVPVKKKSNSSLAPTSSSWLDNIEPCCTHHNSDASHPNTFQPTAILDTWLEGILLTIFNGTLKEWQTDETLQQFTATTLWQAVRTEMNQVFDFGTSENDWLSLQQNSIYAFSSAKSFAQLREMQSFVFEEGKKRSFTDFRADALAVHKRYNEAWLETEFNSATRGTIMGKKWLDIERDKDLFPFLQYNTVGDSRVRQSHERLDGIILPVDSPFWNRFYPPNGWNCRCTVTQMQASQVQSRGVTGEQQAERLGNEVTQGEQYWQKNTGTSKIFQREGTVYFESVPGKMSELEAIRNYRMKSVATIYKNESNLLTTPVPVDDIPSYLQNLTQATDKNNITIQVTGEGAIKSPSHIRALETLASANETWESREGARNYIFYFEDSPVIVGVKKNKLTRLEKLGRKAIEAHRKGVLI